MSEETTTIQVPKNLPILALRNNVLFPQITLPLSVGRARSLAAVQNAMDGDGLIGVVAQKDPDIDSPERDDIYFVGTIAKIHKANQGANGITFLAQGIKRFRIMDLDQTDPFLRAEIMPLGETAITDVESEALFLNLKDQAKRLVKLVSNLPQEVQFFVESIEEPGVLADLAAAHINVELHEKQDILESTDVKDRLRKVIGLINREVQVQELKKQIDSEIKGKFDKTQREMLLREQMRAIQRELGEGDGANEIEELEAAIKKAGMPEAVEASANKELGRLKRTQPASSEYSVIRTYLDWLIDLPWEIETEDNLDLARVEETLDEHHYNLKKVKQRIIEYLAVRKLKDALKGPILCLVGPPGVGKTSLGRSIADALGREFVRVSLGGIRDEAEIRGHRRTYVGALPGKVIQGIKKAGTKNPLFMLDEIDKVGMDFRGDPASALLEVLDPEQNVSFSDHYIEHPFDLTKVLFICTANSLEPIHPALRDRMEILEIPGYTEEEKLEIAKKYIIEEQRDDHGLKEDQLVISEEALKSIIGNYTREAGVRNLKREIASIARGIAREVASERKAPACVTVDDLATYLGPIKHFNEVAEKRETPGVVTGMAWTPTGGDILFVEALAMKGKGNLVLTGHLGDIMKESARTALTFLLSQADRFGIDETIAENQDIHIHFPAGAIPKDGPSAGVTIMTALASLLTGRTVNPELAMTGEITLRGVVMPVGGIKEKLLAARRAGIKEIVLPEKNRKDLDELPPEILKDLKLHLLQRMDEVLELAIGPFPEPKLDEAAPGGFVQ